MAGSPVNLSATEAANLVGGGFQAFGAARSRQEEAALQQKLINERIASLAQDREYQEQDRADKARAGERQQLQALAEQGQREEQLAGLEAFGIQLEQQGAITPEQRHLVSLLPVEKQLEAVREYARVLDPALTPEQQADLKKTQVEIDLKKAQTNRANRLDIPTIRENLIEAGFKPGTPEYEQAARDLLNKPDVQINQPQLQAGFMAIDPNDVSKGVVPIPGGSADPNNPKNFTGEQRKIANFARRLRVSQDEIKEIELTGYNPASVIETGRGIVSGLIGRAALSDEARAYQDYQDEFIRAILRKESGAAITQDERDAYAGYFAQPGDEPQDMARKFDIREGLIGGLILEAGPAYKAPGGKERRKAEDFSDEEIDALNVNQLETLLEEGEL